MEGRGYRDTGLLEGKTAGTSSPITVLTGLQRIAEWVRDGLVVPQRMRILRSRMREIRTSGCVRAWAGNCPGLPDIIGSGFGASRLPQNLGMGHKRCPDRKIFGLNSLCLSEPRIRTSFVPFVQTRGPASWIFRIRLARFFLHPFDAASDSRIQRAILSCSALEWMRLCSNGPVGRGRGDWGSLALVFISLRS